MLKEFSFKLKKWFGFPGYADFDIFLEDIDAEEDLAPVKKKTAVKKTTKKAPAKKVAKKAPVKKTAKKSSVKKK